MKFPDKKTAIGYIVALILGAIGGFTGKDLSGLQQPAEKAATVVVDKAVEKIAPVAPVAPVVDAAPAPAAAAVEAGPAVVK